MSQVIDQTVTPAPVQGSSGAPTGTSSADANLGSFIASIGAVSGALTELLGVVNHNSSKISEYSAKMEQGTMASYEQTLQQAQDNLDNAIKQTKHQGWWHGGFKDIMHGKFFALEGSVIAGAIDKAFPNSKIAHVIATTIRDVTDPTKFATHEMGKILPESITNAFQTVNDFRNNVKDHAMGYLDTAVKQTVQKVAYPFYQVFYHELKLIDPNLSDAAAQKIAHIMADVVAVVLIMVVLTAATDGAADALLAPEAAAIAGEEAGAVIGEEVSAEVAGDIEMVDLAEAGEEAEAAEAVEAAGSSAADATNKMDSQRLQGLRDQFTEARQTMRTIQNILGLIKGVEQLGNAYFDARMAINTKNMGPIQSNLMASQSVLDQVSQINQANMDNLKQTMEDCFSDINALYNGLAGIMASASQAMRG